MISLRDHQIKAVSQLKTGSILCGGVGSGKSLTSLSYYHTVECKGDFGSSFQKNPKDLYIITVAKKRDSLDWDKECAELVLSRDPSLNRSGTKIIVDSWNNIAKYATVSNAFFIFDEQRVVGSGSWVKSFLKITKNNHWILLSATPGDTWLDYIPVFVANGFYKNRTEFLRRHVIYNTFTKFPKVDRYVEEDFLNMLKKSITINMAYEKKVSSTFIDRLVEFDQASIDLVYKKRWNPFKNQPIRNSSELCYTMRKVVNSHPSRLAYIRDLKEKYSKFIVFYNFDYELEILRALKDIEGIKVSEYNGHKHEPIPKSDRWIYLVQYTSGSEAWNCIETNLIVFYSLNYSYRIMSQSAGRIDRMNTPFLDLYYHRLISSSMIDSGIKQSLKEKKDFNERDFIRSRQEHGL